MCCFGSHERAYNDHPAAGSMVPTWQNSAGDWHHGSQIFDVTKAPPGSDREAVMRDQARRYQESMARRMQWRGDEGDFDANERKIDRRESMFPRATAAQPSSYEASLAARGLSGKRPVAGKKPSGHSHGASSGGASRRHRSHERGVRPYNGPVPGKRHPRAHQWGNGYNPPREPWSPSYERGGNNPPRQHRSPPQSYGNPNQTPFDRYNLDNLDRPAPESVQDARNDWADLASSQRAPHVPGQSSSSNHSRAPRPSNANQSRPPRQSSAAGPSEAGLRTFRQPSGRSGGVTRGSTRMTAAATVPMGATGWNGKHCRVALVTHADVYCQTITRPSLSAMRKAM